MILEMIGFALIFIVFYLLIMVFRFKQINSIGKIYDNLLKNDYTAIIPAAIIILLFSLYFFDFTTDDAFISYNYGRNLVDGNGFSYNNMDGLVTEGYSNFLWVLISALFVSAGFDVEIGMKLVGMIFAVLSLMVIYRFTKRIYGMNTAFTASLFFAVYVPISIWSVGGLETSSFIFFMLFGVYGFYIECESGKQHLYSSISFILMALSRPEGIIFYLFIFTAVLIFAGLARSRDASTKRSKGPINTYSIFISFISVIAVYSVYTYWRITYFGNIFPLSFYAKTSDALITAAGLRYLLEFLVYTGPYLLLIFILILPVLMNISRSDGSGGIGNMVAGLKKKYLFGPDKFRYMAYLMFISIFIFNIGFVVHLSAFNAGQGFRFLLPTMPFIAILAAKGYLDNKGIKSVSYLKNILAFLLIINFVVAPLLYVNTSNTDVNDKYKSIGEWYNKYCPDNGSYAYIDAGIIAYYSEVDYIDTWSLMDEHMAKNGFNATYTLDYRPTFIMLVDYFPDDQDNVLFPDFGTDPRFESNYTLIHITTLSETDMYLNEKKIDVHFYKINDFSLPAGAEDELP